MNRQIKKILTILTLIVVLPALFFSIYEFNALTDNEKVIRNIYEGQLAVIIYSVNSVSEDLISNWGNKLTYHYFNNKINKNSSDAEIINFLKQHKSIKYFYTVPSSNFQKIAFYSVDSVYEKRVIHKIAEKFISENKAGVEKLHKLMKSGYQKYEPVTDKSEPELTQILFLSNFTNEQMLTVIGIDSKKFICNDLALKIKGSEQNSFVLSVFEVAKNKKIFPLGNDDDNIGNYSQRRALWLLPEYELAIKLKGATIEEIAKKRINENLVLLFFLTVLLVTGAIIIFRNIKKEVKLAEIKSEFVSNVSHELRTPLSLINMFAETLSMGRVKTEEKKNEYYNIISQEASRLSGIVNKILNFSQIEAGKRKYNFENADMNEIVEKIFNNYRFHLQNKGFKLECELTENLRLIKCDQEAISEAVINIVDNAVKYSTDKKEIKFSTGEEADYLYIAVADKGIGINSEDQKRIFEKFFRVSTKLVHDTKGTGLGLAIVKHIVDAHQGKIELQSKIGEGSKFILKFKKSIANS